MEHLLNIFKDPKNFNDTNGDTVPPRSRYHCFETERKFAYFLFTLYLSLNATILIKRIQAFVDIQLKDFENCFQTQYCSVIDRFMPRLAKHRRCSVVRQQ